MINTETRWVASAVIALATVVTWRTTLPDPPVWYVRIAVDRSESFTERCPALRYLMGEIVDQRPPNMKLNLAVLATGDSTTAMEPVLVRLPDVPEFTSIILEGRSAETQRRARFLEQVDSSCQAMTTTGTSPLYLGVRSALASLRGAKSSDRRTVVLASDLEETSLELLRKSLRGSDSASTVTSLDNRNVDLLLCGSSATRGFLGARRKNAPVVATPKRDGLAVKRIEETWTQLFMEPGRVLIEPYCETSTLRLGNMHGSR